MRLSPLALLASLSLVASAVLAQIPGIPGVAPQKADVGAKASTPETTDQAKARVQKLLDEARAESEGPAEVPPAGIDPREASGWRDAENRLVTAYDIQLRALDELDRARAARKEAEARESDWHGFDTQPPYSILMVDDLRDAEASTRDRIRVLDGEVGQIKLDVQRAQDEARGADEAVRRAEDALVSASTPEEKARLAWQRDLARLKGRAAAAAIVAGDLHTRFRTDELAARRAEGALLAREIAVASAGATFTEADLAKARQRIDDRLAEVRRDLDAIVGQRNARLRERDLAQQALERLRASPSAASGDLAAAKARLDAAESWVASDRDRIDALQGRRIVGEANSALWGERYTAMVGTDPEQKRVAVLKLREALQRAQRYQDYVGSLGREAHVRLSEVETRLSEPGLAPAVVRYEQDALAARRAAVLGVERLQETISSVVAQVERWRGDVDKAAAQRDLRTRLLDGWLALRDGVQRVWNFELFEVEDTTVADGQTVTVSRGVTVGKSVGAILLFILGYWAIAAIARRIEKGLVARGFDAPRLRTKRRWVLAFSAFLLAGLTLNLAHIPFTVFAFLGGALAIGVGFGTQTIIKNFISGMVVLMERQVQVGDIVQVDDITGTVTEVNLRSSTVRGFDGVETIVPNSVLLENKVTNWTRTDRRVRRVVKVGVAYGSPVREVADILVDCAKRHGLVLGEPAPMVIFEDFGDNAMVFGVYFWVDLGPTVNSALVMSDLRFMIEKRFAESGIVVAFPQRDVRLDAAKPLRVEVVPSAAIPRDGDAK